MELGLLMTEEHDVNSEEDEEYYSFQHKLIHEYVAACYVAKQVETNPTFLMDVFTTHEVIYQYIEVVGFCTHVLKSYANAKHMKLFVEHITERFSDKVFEQIENDCTAIQSDFRDRYSEILSVMLPAFGDGDSEREYNFTQMCRGFIHAAHGPYRPPYILYAAGTKQRNRQDSEDRALIIYRCDWSELMAALHLYTGLTHLYINEVGQSSHEYDDLFIDNEDDDERSKQLSIPLKNSPGDEDIIQVGKSHCLRTVWLSGSNLSDSEFRELGEIVVMSSRLRRLEVCNMIAGNMADSSGFRQGLSMCHELQHLVLPGLKFKETGNLCQTISKLYNLTRLDLSNTYLGMFANHVVSAMTNRALSKLTHLNLGACGIPDTAIFCIIYNLYRCPELRYVNLSVNAELGEKFEVLYTDGCSSRALTGELVHRLVQGPKYSTIQHFVLALREQVNIEKLDVSNCEIPVSVMIGIVVQLHHCAKLKSVNLNANSFPEIDLVFSLREDEASGEVIQAELLARIKQVTHFTLVISNETAKADIDTLAMHCPQLKELELGQQYYGGSSNEELVAENIKHIANVIQAGSFSQLQDVDSSCLRVTVSTLLPLLLVLPTNKIKLVARVIKAGSFPQLENLDYSGLEAPINTLGPLFSVVPKHLIQFTLYVDSGTVKEDIHTLAKYCPQLKKIELGQAYYTQVLRSDAKLVAENVKHIAGVIQSGRFPQLQDIDISWLRVSLSTLLPLLPVVPTSLTELSLYVDEEIAKADIDNLVKYVSQMKRLQLEQYFLVTSDELVARNIKHVADAIQKGNFPKLQSIGMWRVKLPPGGLAPLLSASAVCSSLLSLDIDSCNLSQSLHHLTQHPLPSLLYLRLYDCSLTKQDIQSLSECITANKCPRLRVINVRNNSLRGEDVTPLCESLLHFGGPQGPGRQQGELETHKIKLKQLMERDVISVALGDNAISLHIINHYKLKLEANESIRVEWDQVDWYDVTLGILCLDRETAKADMDILVQHCEQLKDLKLKQQDGGNSSNKRLVATNCKHVADAIQKGSFPQLQDIEMRSVKLPPGGRALLLSASAVSSRLLSLDIIDCNLSRSLHHLTQHPLPSLLHLRLAGCSLTKPDIQSLSESITGNMCPRLRIINLRTNKLVDGDVMPLCEPLLQFRGPTSPGRQHGELENFKIKLKPLMERDVISVALRFNAISPEFREQWEGKFAEKKSVCVEWGEVDWYDYCL